MIIELLMKLDVILKNVGCTVTKMLDHNISTLTVLMGGDVAELNLLFTPLTAMVFLVFTLLYTPCIAAIATVHREAGGRNAMATVVTQCVIAWLMAYAVHFLGTLLGLS